MIYQPIYGHTADNAYQSKNQAMRLEELHAELRDRTVLRHRSGEGDKINSAALKVPKCTVACIILKRKEFGKTRTLPWASWTRWSFWLSSRDPVLRWEKLPEEQPSLQHSINLGFMAEWPDGSLSSVKYTWKSHLDLAKKHVKTLRLWETRFSDLMKPRLNCLASILSIMSGGNQAPLITCPIPSQQWSMVVAASSCMGCFSATRTGGLVRIEENWMKQCLEISLMKTWPRL